MTGLKSGSGDDLWGEDTNEDSPPEDDRHVTNEQPTSTEETDHTTAPEQPEGATDRSEETASEESTERKQPYIVRRAIQDRSVQFERDERLTFFVHDDVVEGERELLTEIEAAFGRDVPKFDVREAVYRAALENRDDVLAELIDMGYSPKE
ncbi:MAG: hypothetical protein IH933_00365 [Euryarchaeota archaeon]|jgi:hypothetical protein|nr:hypothetical protein [Euryarchaeota archaeon]